MKGTWVEIGHAFPSDMIYVRNTKKNRRIELMFGLDVLIAYLITRKQCK
jgi:hypothetical protein